MRYKEYEVKSKSNDANSSHNKSKKSKNKSQNRNKQKTKPNTTQNVASSTSRTIPPQNKTAPKTNLNITQDVVSNISKDTPPKNQTTQKAKPNTTQNVASSTSRNIPPQNKTTQKTKPNTAPNVPSSTSKTIPPQNKATQKTKPNTTQNVPSSTSKTIPPQNKTKQKTKPNTTQNVATSTSRIIPPQNKTTQNSKPNTTQTVTSESDTTASQLAVENNTNIATIEQKTTTLEIKRETIKSILPKKKDSKKIILTIINTFATILLSVLIFLIGGMAVIFNGPSVAARDLMVNTCMETSFAKIFPPLFLSNDVVTSIKKQNTVVDDNAVTDDKNDFTSTPVTENKVQKDLEIVNVNGPTFNGKMLIVKDPSRISVAVPPKYGEDVPGVILEQLVKNKKSIAGINGGGFFDAGGVGNGGTPLGFVFSDGKLVYGGDSTGGSIIGFDNKNRLIVGNMTAGEAKSRGVRDAVTFGPALIVNGEPSTINGTGGGLNPRTAIGQRDDGSVLMLVIDGRQPQSVGASYKDLINVMLDFKAVNAANLDGGSSSTMVYEDKIINMCASLSGPRKLPNAFVVN